jgi:hypothetical protein
MVSGMVEGLQPASTLWVCNEALSGGICSIIIEKGMQTVLAAWMPSAEQVGFVLLDGQRDKAVHDAILAGGNVTSAETFEEFKLALKTEGWKIVKPDDVPTSILVLVDGALTALTRTASWIANTPITFIVIPAGVEALPEFMQPQEMH